MSIIYSNLNTNGYKSIKYLYKNSTMLNSNIKAKSVYLFKKVTNHKPIQNINSKVISIQN